MNNGDTITVAHGDKLITATALKLKNGWWWSGKGYSGPLVDEGIHYVRGSLWMRWPPHKKRGNALLVAAALGEPPPMPVSPIPMRLILKGLSGDFQKLADDARRVGLVTSGESFTRSIRLRYRRTR